MSAIGESNVSTSLARGSWEEGTVLTPTQRNPKLRLLIPLIVATGFFLEQLDSTIITTAIPDIARGLHETPLRLNIALTSYLITLAVFIPISGWMADRFGTRRIFTIAIAVFTLGSMACGASTSFGMLIASRILQGLGGAMMNPVGRLILLRSFPRADLVTAMSYMSVPAVLGPVIGPLAGGLITTYASWRWIFYVNIPFGLAGMALAWRFIEDVDHAPPGRFDLPGFFICAVAMASLEIGLENIGHPEMPPVGIAAVLLLAALAGVAYVAYARRHDNAVLDLGIMRIRSFRVAALAGGVCRIGLNGVPFLLPLMLQIGFGYTPVQSGATTFVSSLGTLVIRPVTAILLRTLGFDRLLIGNAVVGAAVILIFAWVSPATPYALLIAVILLFGIVRNTQFNAVQTLTYADVPPPLLSQATSLGGVTQQLTMGFGVSVSATLLGVIAGSDVTLGVAEFHRVFFALAAILLLSIPGLLALRPQDGALVSKHKRGGKVKPPASP